MNITVNDIRKSYETYNINSSFYNTLTNKQKQDIHFKILHNMNTAHSIYNKITD